jgi:membrane protease YdiL (CAAX protease family)
MENLLAGFTEEMCVRGLMFPLIVKANNNRRQIILISALLSSIIFGLLHYSNLKNQPGNFEGITSQVVFGFAIGMYFCGLLLRTENILVPAVMHGLFNITFGPKNIMLTPVSNISDQRETQFFDWSSFVSTSIVFLLILFIGIFMIRKADKQSVFRKLLEES